MKQAPIAEAEGIEESGHVLIAEDCPDDASLLLDMLRGAQFRISLAFDGYQAYNRALSGRPDLILMDVSMPRVDGFAACRLLKANPHTAHIPIIFLTAMRRLDERLEGLRNGGVDYVLKPYDAAEVLARILIHLPFKQKYAVAVTSPFELAWTEEQVMVNAAIRYLLDHLSQPPSVDALARYVGTYQKRLAQAFREVLGKTVYGFLREERVRTAARLLYSSQLSLIDIASEVGFSTAANFSTAFRQQVGITPRQFRKLSRGA